MKPLLCLLTLLISFIAFGQRDTLRFKNGDVMVGEVKNLAAGVLTIKTRYSKKDFTIKFNRVRELIIERKCIVTLTQGRNNFGYIRTSEEGKISITEDDGNVIFVPINQITSLQEVDDNFWSRFRGAIDIGANITKANNNRQLNTSARISYSGIRWLLDGQLDILISAQDSVTETSRTDANIEGLRLLGNNYFITTEIAFLQNTAQALDARISPSLGYGKFLINTNKMYLGVAAGFNYNIERFVNENENRESSELFVSLGLNMFDYEKIDLLTGIRALPSLSEKERFRIDYNFKFKYKIIKDFYISAGLTINYDNQPSTVGESFDYVVNTGFGWKFNE
ncbi:MAG: DUF481 domain-containing protein [Flavobacteriaceae bacterium]